MHISSNNNQYRAAIGNAIEFRINQTVAHIAAGVAIAYNVPVTRPYIKPLVDFGITTVFFVTSYWQLLLAIVLIYIIMERTGLLKSCKQTCGLY